MRARTIHGDQEEAGVPLTRTFNQHVSSLLQSDASNFEVQNRFDAARKAGRPGPSISFSGNEAHPLFHNTGRGFVEIGTTMGISRTEDSRGFVLVDLDGDGAQDLVIHNFFRHPIVALLNRAAGDHRWLRVKLRGTTSNRFGIGAQVTVSAEGRKQLQELQCGSGYGSCHPPELHYGLGNAEKADLRVRWPSGKVEEYKGLEANRVHTLVEGDPKAARAEKLQPIAIEPDPAEDAPGEPDVRALLSGLRTLGGEPAPVKATAKAPVLAILASVDCHVCIEEFKRQPEIERRAAEAGVNLVWIAVDADPRHVESAFAGNEAKFRPLATPVKLGSIATPTVYFVTPDRVEKFTGRFAVIAALEEAAPPRR